jgi:hypothetical protein
MAETFTNLIYHIVFSTKNRQPLITGDHQSRLKSFRDEFIEFLEANGIEYDEKYL